MNLKRDGLEELFFVAGEKGREALLRICALTGLDELSSWTDEDRRDLSLITQIAAEVKNGQVPTRHSIDARRGVEAYFNLPPAQQEAIFASLSDEVRMEIRRKEK